MKKPITIVVIAVIATILVTSAVDYSAIGAKPSHEIHAQGIARDNGDFVCPDGSSKTFESTAIDIFFSEEQRGNKGYFVANGITAPQEQLFLSSQLYQGSIDSQSYLLKGIDRVHSTLCGLENNELQEFTVWGECGRNVVINFETDLGVSGNSIGTVICV